MILISNFITITALLALAAPVRSPLAAQQDEAAVARKVATISSIALDEYALGVVDGRVVQANEVEEARLFLAEARRLADALPPAARRAALGPLDSLIGGVSARAASTELRRMLDGMRRELEREIGVALDPMPAVVPALARGETIYRQYCTQCHGVVGRGDGPAAGALDPPPADQTDRARLVGSSPLDFFRKVTVGVAGTGMPAFEAQLGLDDRWAVALYASGLRFTAAERDRGGREMRAQCGECLMLASDFGQTVGLSDDTLSARLAGIGRPALPDSTAVARLAYARTASASDVLGHDRRIEAERTIRQARSGVARAVDLAVRGDRQAAVSAALEAYLIFERVETRVRARDAAVARRVEDAFTGLRGALGGGQPPEIEAARAEVEGALGAALVSPDEGVNALSLFGQALVIMLREGLEAILIIGALIAFLARAGARERSREIGWGVLAAIGASLVTAAAFATVWSYSTGQREALEGLTMVIGAAVLFWVSYWLVSKIELRKWQAFVGAQMGRALSSRSAWALAAVAFLAVYREGFETVLFYAALYASGAQVAGASAGITAGIGLGFILLTVLYLAIQRFGVRIPIKPFFAVTSALLYLMAFSFAGQGVAELQEAGYVPTTPLAWVPSIPFLGIFPTTQTLAIQLFLAVALFAALTWVFWLEPRAVAGNLSRKSRIHP